MDKGCEEIPVEIPLHLTQVKTGNSDLQNKQTSSLQKVNVVKNQRLGKSNLLKKQLHQKVVLCVANKLNKICLSWDFEQ